MTTFTVNVLFRVGDTANLNGQGVRLALAKGHVQPGETPKFWATAGIFEENEFIWTDTYGLYASPVPESAALLMAAQSTLYPAEMGMSYPFVNNVFGSPSAGQPGTYSMVNDSGHTCEMGLLQQVEANRSKVMGHVATATLATHMTGTFAPRETASVLLYKQDSTGDRVYGMPITVMADGATTVTVHYSADMNGFMPGSL